MTNDRPDDDERDDFDPSRDLEDLLRNLLAGGSVGGISMDPQELAKLSGLPVDAASLSRMFAGLRHAMASHGDGIDWSLARNTAIDVASSGSTSGTVPHIHDAFGTASLWLDEATSMGAASDAPRTIGRVEWVQQTIDTWIEMAEPVALSISDTL